MRVRVLAADSMGVRSLSVAIETSEGLLVIDPGASLAPRRYGLPPHPLELRELERAHERILRAMEEADIIVITHYHYDHYIRRNPEAYKGKILLVKHPRRDINRSQAIRSHRLLKKEGVEGLARELVFADSSVYKRGRLTIEFSPPVWHGAPGSRVGRVLMVRVIDGDEAIIYTSDSQGPADPDALKILEGWVEPRPKLVIVDGPPSYFAGFKVPVRDVELGFQGLRELVARLRPRTVIVDHHLLRDLAWRSKLSGVAEVARSVGVRLVSAAEYMGVEENLLEARRRELWKGEGSE